jgi:hypothetical protein
MIELKTSFRRDGHLYTQTLKNEFVALYAVGGEYSDRTNYWEVCKIYIRKPDKYGELREALPSNEQFGRDLSQSFNNYKSALKYFEELTSWYKLQQLMPKIVAGGQAIVKMVPECQAA